MNRAIEKIVLSLSLPLCCISSSRASAPPEDRPQACTSSFCVLVMATEPDLSNKFVFSSRIIGGRDTLDVNIGRGGFMITFSSAIVDGKVLRAPRNELYWERSGKNGVSWACLSCNASHEESVVLNISALNVPDYYRNLPADYLDGFFGLSVCFWSIDYSARDFWGARSLILSGPRCVKSRRDMSKFR